MGSNIKNLISRIFLPNPSDRLTLEQIKEILDVVTKIDYLSDNNVVVSVGIIEKFKKSFCK